MTSTNNATAGGCSNDETAAESTNPADYLTNGRRFVNQWQELFASESVGAIDGLQFDALLRSHNHDDESPSTDWRARMRSRFGDERFSATDTFYQAMLTTPESDPDQPGLLECPIAALTAAFSLPDSPDKRIAIPYRKAENRRIQNVRKAKAARNSRFFSMKSFFFAGSG